MSQVIALEVRSSSLLDGSNQGIAEFSWVAQMNQCLPGSIRVLAYDDEISETFDARFSCKARHYKYLFAPRISGSKDLDIGAMQAGCERLIGIHDFRNFCKLDASKQITNFERHIKRCGISRLPASQTALGGDMGLLVLDLVGSAFLWHQVRCIAAVLLLIGQGHERPEIITDLLDITRFQTKPVYEMADDWPLTLWDCDFGDAIKWKYPANSHKTLETTFEMLHEARIKDTITGFLVESAMAAAPEEREKSGILLGDGRVRVQHNVVPLHQRRRMEAVEVINAAWQAKKDGRRAVLEDSLLPE